MPGKHVRFSRTNSYRSPSPIHEYLPSSSSRSSSSARHSGHRSHRHPTRSNTIQVPVQPQLHPLLAASASYPIYYDVRFHPSSLSSAIRGGFSGSLLSEPATHPAVSALTVVLPYVSSAWSVAVRATTRSYVTVTDVLDAIYVSLRANIDARAFYALDSAERRRVTSAYEVRYHINVAEKPKGVKRVDFLHGHRFAGLIPTRHAGVWEL
ncbi:hypothetical protein FISHEDRAFT_6358, partial [Fistulina hepatica ATCC 64428]